MDGAKYRKETGKNKGKDKKGQQERLIPKNLVRVVLTRVPQIQALTAGVLQVLDASLLQHTCLTALRG